jgi:hypothetical protein
MWFHTLLASWKSGRSRVRPHPRPAHRRTRLVLEHLENRTLPSNYSAASVSALIADINTANNAGGSNTITLTAPTTSPYVLTAVDNATDGPTGLPVISGGMKTDNLTVIGNGDTIERSTAPGTPAFRLFAVAAGSLTMQNLTLQGGVALGSYVSAEGGGIYNQGTLTLSGVIVQDNSAEGTGVNTGPGENAAGGGIYSSGYLTLDSTTVQHNLALGGNGGPGFLERAGGDGGNAFGGGVDVARGTAILTNATLSSNTAWGGQGGNNPDGDGGNGGNGLGGGLMDGYWSSDTVTGGGVSVVNSTLSFNAAQGGQAGNQTHASVYIYGGHGFGGGAEVDAGGLTLSSDTISSNGAEGSVATGLGIVPGFGGGGGVGTRGGTVKLETDTVESNTADHGGGLWIASGGIPGAAVYLDSFTVANTINNTDSTGLNGSTANIDGTYILQNP